MIASEHITHHLTQYAEFCERFFEFLLKENTLITQDTTAITQAFIDQKNQLFKELTRHNNTLQAILQKYPTTHDHLALIRSTQAQLLKILMLNRDNEQLLLRCAFHHQETLLPKIIPNTERAAQSYARHTSIAQNSF